MTSIKQELKKRANPKKAKLLSGFFKIGKGHYGEGDVFLGVMVPQSREVARQFLNLELKEVERSLFSKFHEERLVALLILVEKYKRGNKDVKEEIFNFYLKNTKWINNWDLVDLTSHKIVGEWLLDKDRNILYELAKSENLWEKRISIISCFAFIRNNDFKDALEISKILFNDKHDLIHKAVGWVLIEIGKINLKAEEKFLQEEGRYKNMPRTMLRYAIEKFDESRRKKYLKGEI